MNNTPYGYKGQWGYYTDGETGLLLLTHRYYEPATGRFLTRDPAGCEASVNLYAYVRNGVMNKIDPSGLCTKIGKQCYGWDCHGDPDCPPAKRPKPKPKPIPGLPMPKPPPGWCLPSFGPGCPPGQTCISRYPCPPGTTYAWYCGGWCIGSEAGCLLKCTWPGLGEFGEELCQQCCEDVGEAQGWSRSKINHCMFDCIHYSNSPDTWEQLPEISVPY
jgi:RHS repeat-associated protein